MGSDAPQVEGYRLLRQIGAGGMGTVHEAVDAEGRHVALKLLHPHIGADPGARQRLEREVQLLNRVRDAGVARVMDADVDAVRPFVVTELVHGPTLEQDVAAGGPFAPDELLTLGHGLADALEAIHAVGVVHRDLKPGNVMLSDHGPVLIDFGIAQVADDARLTQTGMVTGTPGYLAPEVIDGGEPEPEGDWWAWAAVLVFAATGRPPFGRGPYAAVLARVSTGQVDTAGLEPRLARALRAALAPDPARRLDRDGVLEVLSGGEAPAPTTVLAGDVSGPDDRLGRDGRDDGGSGPDHGSEAGRDDGSNADRTRALPSVGHAPAGGDGTPRPPAGGAVAQLPGAVGEQPTRALPQHQPVRWDEAAGPVPGPGAPPPGGSGWPPPGPERPVPGSAWPDPGVPPPLPPWAVRPRRRTLLVGAAGLALTALTVHRPGAFVVLALALLLVTGAVGWAGRARRASRMRRGPRRGDDARMYAGLP
ncbi:serine/threonine-protein kinase, partial [Georgenia sp. 10Sc9-8]|nr:serine/threonine-protein kinase [Georgenia halotolerans]